MTQTALATLIESISGPGMWGHLEAFAQWTKHAGTPGELDSLRYCERHLKDYGYATRILMHDAYISIPGKARAEHEGKSLTPCISHSFSCSSPAGGLTAAAVHVGPGGEQDFAGKDVRGKIVVVDGIASPGVSRRASRAGALGQLHVTPHQHVHEMCISPVWGSPTHETVHDLPTTVVVTVNQENGAPIKSKLMAGEAVTLTLHADVDTGWRQTPILVADLGSAEGGADEPFVMFSGHHDTWYYGVMDNGGANATMLEVARLAAQRRAEWRRALRLVFWSGHSQGRYSSSSWYADEYWEELEARALVHVNIDSTGGKGNTVVADATSAAELRHVARAAISEQGQQQHTGRRQSRAGDQAFWGIGVPAIFGNMSEQPGGGTNASAAVFGTAKRLGHGTGWWWHTPDDLLDKMDEGILVRDTRIYMQVLWRLLTDKVLPFDYAEHAVYLRDELAALQQEAGAKFDLGVLIQRARELEHLATTLNRRAAAASGEAEIARINRGLVEVSRALVPVDYTTGDRFGQDPALPQGIYPSIQPVRRFAKLAADSADAKFLHVGMMRARNRVAVALREANAALTRCLADLGAKPN